MSSAIAPFHPSAEQGPDRIEEAVGRLRASLPQRSDVDVLLGFLEDDLREGLAALGELEAHFVGILESLGSERLSPIALLDAGDDLRALERIDYLAVVTSQLRRRLALSAGRLRDARRVTT